MGKRVVKSKKRSKAVKRAEFNFTHEMLPIQSNGKKSSDAAIEFREKAWGAYQQLSLPNTRQEAWRRTDIRGLQADTFTFPEVEAFEKLAPIPKDILHPQPDVGLGGQIVLLPGGVSQENFQDLTSRGIVFTDLQTAEIEHTELLHQVRGQLVKPGEDKFSALTAAFASAGVFIYIPKGVHLDAPLHSVMWGPGVGLAYASHIVVWLEEGSSLTYVHEVASPTESLGQSFHSGTIEVRVSQGAHLKFIQLQSWGEHVWSFNHERIQVDRDGKLEWVYGAVGGQLTKSFTNVDLIGEGAEGNVSGFYITGNRQHMDHDTQQNHMVKNTSSDLLYKGALEDNSRSVWQGMIYVAPGAQKTDGYQANRNLVLNRNARADSIPGLEILADDVRCTHGATIGKIDPDQIFYLNSRGVPTEQAERLIVSGFFSPILDKIPFEDVRNRYEQAILTKLK